MGWRMQLELNFHGNIELVKFREFLEQRIENQQPPLSHVPDEHKPLIAKFTQERCVSTLCFMVVELCSLIPIATKL